MKNWKTSLAGLMAAIGLFIGQSDNAQIKNIASIVGSLGIALGGLSAADSKKDE